MGGEKADILRGTLDLLVLKTLDVLGPMHGYGIAQRIQQVSGDLLSLNQGTLYPALLRLEQRGWVQSRLGTSDNNRRARFYALTPAGRRQLRQETSDWVKVSGVINRILRATD
ncbi:MAG TPA: PadR family transcriptional regulator [Vicinamibacterales bacterium]|nr:PadR family transcriptional regulator [Vicinamibacterales bacterium]